MSLLWVVGPAAAVVGALLAVVWHRRVAGAAQDLTAAVAGLDDVRHSVRDLRALGGQVAAKTGRLREG